MTDIASGGAYQPKDLNWMQVSNDYARSTFRYDGFYTPFQVNQYYRVDEEVTAFYAMSNFDFEIGGLPSKLNAGVRAVDTDVTSFWLPSNPKRRRHYRLHQRSCVCRRQLQRTSYQA